MKKGSLATVFLAVLIDLMGFGIVLPLLPFYATTFHASAATIGLLYSIFSFAQLIFSPMWGELSDRIGRRPVMLISSFGTIIAYLIFGVAHTLWLLFLSRLVAGAMGGNISTAQAYVADVTSHEDRAKGMGMLGAAFGIGFVLGPALATILIHPRFLSFFHIAEENRFMMPGFFAAFLSFLSFLLILFKLPETVTPTHRDTERIVKHSIFGKTFWLSIFAGKKHTEGNLFPLLILSMFLLSFGQASMYSAFPLFCKFQLNLSPEDVGMLFVYMGIIAIMIQGVLLKRLVRQFGEVALFVTGCVFMVAGFILLPFATNKHALALYLSLMGLGTSLNGPTLTSLISKESDPKKVGLTMGTSQGMGSLGRTIGPTWSGYLYDLNYFLSFFMTALFLSSTIWIGVLVKKVHRKKETRLSPLSEATLEE